MINKKLGQVISTSSVYLSPAYHGNDMRKATHKIYHAAAKKVDIVDQLSYQHYFLNAVIKLNSRLNPFDLLAGIEIIEKKLGKNKLLPIINTPGFITKVWRDRTIDIDILLAEDMVIDDAKLIIPHYDLLNRLFFLAPLLEIAKDSIHPHTQKPLKIYLENLKYANLPLKHSRVKLF